MPPRTCATAIADALEAEKDEATMANWGEKFLAALNRFVPSLFRGLARREA